MIQKIYNKFYSKILSRGKLVIRKQALFYIHLLTASDVPDNFVRGVQQIHLRTEDRENGDLGEVAP